MSSVCRKNILLLISCFIFAGAALSFAEENLLVPYIIVEGEYNDNVFFSSDGEEDDFITHIAPGLEWKKRTERLDADIDVKLDGLIYSDLSDLDTLDGDGMGRFHYMFTERFGGGASAGYRKNSRSDSDITSTGLILEGKRYTTTCSATGDYIFSEKTKGSLSWSFQKDDIEDSSSDEDDLQNRVVLGLTSDLSEHFSSTVGMMNLSYTRYESDLDSYGVIGGQDVTYNTQSDYDMFQLVVGVTRQPGELLSYFINAGAVYTMSDQEQSSYLNEGSLPLFPPSSYSDNNWGGVLNVGVTYRGEYLTTSLKLGHDMSAASGYNSLVNRTSLVLYLKYRLTEALSLTLSSGGYVNNGDREFRTDLDELTFRVEPGVRYDFTRSMYASASYTYTSVDDREGDDDRIRNRFFMRFVKEFEFNL